MATYFPEQWLNELRSRNDIVSVVSQYVPLQAKGRRYWGCCPFHSEKTPSFSVNPEMQMYYCFGCKAAGNVIGFIMAAERLDFFDAVKLLAERVNMPLPEMDERGRQDYQRERVLKDQLYEVNLMAAQYFRDQLNTSAGKQARAYLARRGLSEHTIRRFGLGYAPDSWNALLDFATKKGIPKERLVQAGLAVQSKGRTYDAFRNRVIFPIINTMGRVIAFGGRVMDQSLPKYLNSPETPVFNKRHNLYGLNFVKRQHKPEQLFVMEGYMDVVSVAQQGVMGAVASLGTALTSEQARLLKRYVDRVILSYDGDSAGQNAALRGLDILHKEGLEVRVLPLPEGMDPDEYIRKFGKEAWDKLAQDALTLPAFKMKIAAKRQDLSTLDGRTKYAIAAAKIIAAVENAVEQEIYLKRLQVETGFSMESLKAQVDGSDAELTPRHNVERTRNTKDDAQTEMNPETRAGWSLLANLASNGEGLAWVYEQLEPQALADETQQMLYQKLRTTAKEGVNLAPSDLLDEIEDSEKKALAARMLAGEQAPEQMTKYVQDLVWEIKSQAVERKISQLQSQLKQSGLDAETRSELLREIQALIVARQSGRRHS